MQIEGRVFVVTGGGAGIGREVVLTLLASRARVAAVDVRPDGLAETTRLAGRKHPGKRRGRIRGQSGAAPDPPGAAGADSGGMTANEPINPASSELPNTDGQPAWGNAPTSPPAGSGSDTESSSGATPPSTEQSGPQDATPPPGTRFFDRLRGLGIVRPDPDQGRMIAGVAAGIARRYQVDAVAVRIAFVLASLVAGLGILLYGLGWMFLPHPDGRIHAQQVLNGTVTAGFVGALLTTLTIAHHALPFLLIALVIWLIVRHRRTSRAQTA